MKVKEITEVKNFYENEKRKVPPPVSTFLTVSWDPWPVFNVFSKRGPNFKVRKFMASSLVDAKGKLTAALNSAKND